ncbi:MAG: cation transporter [Rhodobacteraceae bacterium]|nr:MAG: cation transporter [Paracoccaceae bacterium]
MVSEDGILRRSLAAILLVAALGIGFGIVSGSFAILFDGVFSLIDAAMTVLSLFVARLITRSTLESGLSDRLNRRFSMGFWHLEPMVLTLNATILFGVMVYASFSALLSLFEGGRTMEFGPALVYAGVVVAISAGMALYEHRAIRRAPSDFVKMDLQGWIMSGGVTTALLVAFAVGYAIQDTDHAWITPYVDPAVLLAVCLVLLPMPIGILRRAASEVLLITPDDLLAEVERVAAGIVTEEGFLGHRAYVARVGRGTQIEIYFIAPTGQPPRRLEDWDALRDRIGAELGGDPRHRWLTIAFTTDPARAD